MVKTHAPMDLGAVRAGVEIAPWPVSLKLPEQILAATNGRPQPCTAFQKKGEMVRPLGLEPRTL